jgi:Uma2 family endonuclease
VAVDDRAKKAPKWGDAMSVTLAPPPAAESEGGEQLFVIGGVSWDAYVKTSDALDDHPGLRMIYCDGRLVFVGKSRTHVWFAERLGEFVKAWARGLGIAWEDAGRATYRSEKADAGLEGDKTFYLGENAAAMRGPLDIDLSIQPPPDLVIEVDVNRSAEAALLAWGRLGVPEVWKFQPKSSQFAIHIRSDDGSYSEHSAFFAGLTSVDVLNQLSCAKELGADRWNEQLEAWVAEIIRARLTVVSQSWDDDSSVS